MSHGRSSWKRPVLHVHPSSHASVALSAGTTGLELTRACISSHLFLSTLCRACRIVLLDCTLIIALEREYSQCVVCVQSRYIFFSPYSSAWTLDLLGTCETELLFTWAFTQCLKRSCLPALWWSFETSSSCSHGDKCGPSGAQLQRRPNRTAQLKSLTI